MRHVVFALLLITYGCASGRGGMTTEDFTQKCRTTTLQEPSRMVFSNGDIVLGCQMKGIRADPKFLLFRIGEAGNRVSVAKVFAHLEDDRCLSFGAIKGRPDYVDCRTALAILRAQNKGLLRALEQPGQHNGLALMQYGLILQQMGKPQTMTAGADCKVRNIGTYTSYNCH